MRNRSLTFAALGLVSIALASAVALESKAFWKAVGGEQGASGDSPGAIVGSLFASAIDGEEEEAGESGRVHLRVPSRDSLLIPAMPPHMPSPVPEGALRAHAYQYVSRVFARPSKRPRAQGFVRRGMVLHARERVYGPGCRGGWYTLLEGGVVCSSDGFFVAREPRAAVEQRRPDVASAMPFRYAKVATRGALRFFRIPSQREEAEIAKALENDRRLPEVVERRMNGVYLLALDREERKRKRSYHRTVRGRYVRAEDIEPKPEPTMRGVLLSERDTLPYAFVYGLEERKQAPVYRVSGNGSAAEVVGVADNHARIRVLREAAVGDQVLVVGPNGLALARSQVRIARRTERPADVPADAKWIHVDLKEQALIAYEGDRPVFATLVSSGKGEDYATPTGLFRVAEKHISTTMRGPDPDEGVYEVEEVPWTMYYDNSYALHGAYWHNSFGKTRSHGCTNISPIDARWLFYWSDGDLPSGWNALRKLQGTYVYLTGVADAEISKSDARDEADQPPT